MTSRPCFPPSQFTSLHAHLMFLSLLASKLSDCSLKTVDLRHLKSQQELNFLILINISLHKLVIFVWGCLVPASLCPL